MKYFAILASLILLIVAGCGGKQNTANSSTGDSGLQLVSYGSFAATDTASNTSNVDSFQGSTSATYSTTTTNADTVAGTDGLEYQCLVSHSGTPSSEPITGSSYTTYWKTTGNVVVYTVGDTVTGSDGHSYAAKVEHTSSASTAPVTGASYIDYWKAVQDVATVAPAWQLGQTYTLADQVLGTDGLNYGWSCLSDGVATADNKPITGASYVTCWKATSTGNTITPWQSGQHYVGTLPDGTQQWQNGMTYYGSESTQTTLTSGTTETFNDNVVTVNFTVSDTFSQYTKKTQGITFTNYTLSFTPTVATGTQIPIANQTKYQTISIPLSGATSATASADIIIFGIDAKTAFAAAYNAAVVKPTLPLGYVVNITLNGTDWITGSSVSTSISLNIAVGAFENTYVANP